MEQGNAGSSMEQGNAVSSKEQGNAVSSMEQRNAGSSMEQGNAGSSMEQGNAVSSMEQGNAGSSMEHGNAGSSMEQGNAGSSMEQGNAGSSMEQGNAVGSMEQGNAVGSMEQGNAVGSMEQGNAVGSMEQGNARRRNRAMAMRISRPEQAPTVQDVPSPMRSDRHEERLQQTMEGLGEGGLGEGGLGEAALGVFSGDAGLKRRALPAAFNGRCLPRVRLLLQRGCLSMEGRDCLGRTLLYRAVQDNDLNYARLFLQCHADVKAADSQLSPGLQPLLHLAVTRSSPDMVGLLVEAGADPYAIHGAWGSALRLAVRHRKPKVVRVLLEGGTGPRDRHRKAKVVRGLLKGGTGPRDRQSQRDYQSLLRLAVRESRRRTFDLLWRHRGSSFPCVDLFAYALFACNKLAFARTILKRSRGPKLIAMKELSGLRYVCQADEATFNPKLVFQRWTKAMALRWAEPKTPVLKEEPPDSLARLLGTREVQTRRELAELPRTWDQTLVQAVLVAERLVPRRRELTWLLVKLAEALFKRHEDRLAAAVLVRAVRAALTCHVTKVDGTTRESLLQTVADCEESHVDRLTRDDVLRLLEMAACAVRGGAPYFTRDFPAAGSRRSRVTSFADGCVWRNLRRWFTLQGPATPEQVGLLEASLTRYVRDRHALRLLFPLQRMRDVNCVRALEVLVGTSAAVWGECGQEGHPFHLAPDVDGDTPLHILAQHVPAALLTGDRGVVAIFLEHGAHLCARNGKDCRIADTLEARQILVAESHFPCLKCLAARVVPRRPSLEESVPRVVWKFLQDH